MNHCINRTSFPVMLILESITLISGTAPSSSEASLLSNSSKNSSPVPACNKTREYCKCVDIVLSNDYIFIARNTILLAYNNVR